MKKDKTKNKKLKTIIVQDGDDEYVINSKVLEALTDRIRAHLPSRCGKSKDCSFKSYFDFNDDAFEVGQDLNEDDYHFRHFNARQLATVGHFLRRSIMKHRWNEAAHLTHLLCQPGIMLYRSTIFSACFMLLINHPMSNMFLFEKFVRQCTQYVLPEEVEKFMKIIFAIREEPLPRLRPGKYIRKEHNYKAVDDISFKDL